MRTPAVFALAIAALPAQSEESMKDIRIIVKTDKGHDMLHSKVMQGSAGAHGHVVLRRKDRRRPVIQGQQFPSDLGTLVQGPDVHANP